MCDSRLLGDKLLLLFYSLLESCGGTTLQNLLTFLTLLVYENLFYTNDKSK